ncbi:fungal-specific transcription factor domain-containing protein [Dactylonectria macrodidyma]|uniref:Fungal-specific transcription factor domain-containing protein n=1 Tax=Dactylonectria macrodidyma TaxID=307937 RepID=A0A9P9FAH7_9HYPO|nr:fungal-specific transcription factor domain-containing protein [Dactylonectria macrodidyma]
MFRHLMSAKVRSNAGCWTCRLRRKKCDEKRPICEGCSVLEITCHNDETKPDWMDGGPKQKAMAERIKAQVKKQASQRRDRKYMDMLESGTRNVTLEGQGEENAMDLRNDPKGPGHEYAEASVAHSDTDPPSSHDTGSTPASSNTSGCSPPEAPWHNQFLARPEETAHAVDVNTEVHFIMIYLDYVFPHLFPFYRPPMLAGGRGWVLDVLQSNKSVWHTAISLASYFFSIVLANGNKDHEECTNRMVHQLQVQLEMGLRELQREMSAINTAGCRAGPKERLLVLQGILQMLIFEVSTSNTEHWRMHLDAAIAMFLQIIPTPEVWTEVLVSLYSLKWPPPEMGVSRPFSTSQAALRFFTANIIYIDVMASITLEQAPRLQAYQAPVIPGCRLAKEKLNVQSAGPLFMEDFTGLQNWVVQIIGDIAALDAWKKDQKRAGSLSTTELVQRGKIMDDAIKAGLEAMENEFMARVPPNNPVYAILANTVPPSQPGITDQSPPLLINNVIWLQAAMTYLYVVISGWQPSCPEIRNSVSRMTTLLNELPQDTGLRTLAWPFCIAGCLSPPEDECTYRAMVLRMGSVSVFGTVKAAMEIMEAVWAQRNNIDESWDVGKCMKILGHGVLLI